MSRSGLIWDAGKKRSLGCAHHFRPTYALANVGHPSIASDLISTRAMLARMRLRMCSCLFFLPLLLITFPLNARVLRVEVASRTTVLNGKAFGDAGAYERITGRVYFSLPVTNVHNARIVDLSNAVNLKDGEVEFSSDFVAVRPRNVRLGNGSMLLEVPNRGNERILSLVDGGDQDLAHDAGDAWLLRNGYTIVSLGWQWDAQAPGALRFFAPIAKENGNTITGLLRGDLMLSEVLQEIPLGHLSGGHLGGIEYPVAVRNDPRNVLTFRPLHTPRWRLPAGKDLRIRLCGSRSGRGRRRLRGRSRLCFLCQTRSRRHHACRAGLWRGHFAKWAFFARLPL
jgi:hypothetical protein